MTGKRTAMAKANEHAPIRGRRRALVVYVFDRTARRSGREWAVSEFEELARSAGFDIAGTLTFNIGRKNPATFIGPGQLESVKSAFGQQISSEPHELSDSIVPPGEPPDETHDYEPHEHDFEPGEDAPDAPEDRVDAVLVNVALSPVHQRNWRQALGAPVLTRADVIFDIFERNAHTAEGKLQVEVARLRYDLPRIMHIFEEQSGSGAGIGTRGPGEKLHLKTKREIERRIHVLAQKLDKVARDRALRRARRAESEHVLVSLVGYTNAGKSSLLNLLTGSEAYVDDRYFATLDPTVRRLTLPDGAHVLLADTVGFIEDLPPELLAAFKATLDELADSDVIVHVVDLSRADVWETVDSVEAILDQRGLADIPRVTILNKLDIEAEHELTSGLLLRQSPCVAVSARTKAGVPSAVKLISDAAGWVHANRSRELAGK